MDVNARSLTLVHLQMYDAHGKSQCINNSDGVDSDYVTVPDLDELEQVCSDSDDDNDVAVAGCDLNVDTTIEHSGCSQELLQQSSATLLLGLREKHKLTYASIQSIIQGVCSLNQQQLVVLKSEVKYCMWI